MSQKREEIINEEKQLDRILPKLAALYDNKKSNTKVEVYIGWRGIETVYSSFLKMQGRVMKSMFWVLGQVLKKINSSYFYKIWERSFQQANKN